MWERRENLYLSEQKVLGIPCGVVGRGLHDLVSLDELKKELADKFMEQFELVGNARRFIEEGFEQDRTLSWRGAFKKKLGVTQEKHTAALKEAVRKRAIEALEKM